MDAATAVHELGHRFQYSVSSLTTWTMPSWSGGSRFPGRAFRERPNGRPWSPATASPGRSCAALTTSPTNRYMGKEYGNVTEIITMGMESLFTGTNGGLIVVGHSDADREFRDFILGAVATAGT